MPELLLLRHGIAEERSPDCPDAERALTRRGLERTRAVVRRLVALNLRCDQLLTSPLRRAQQTAELAVAEGLAPALGLAEALAPGGDPRPLLHQNVLHKNPPHKNSPYKSVGVGRLALVGHEPDLGDLAAGLIGAPAGALALKKAGVALLQRDQAPGDGAPGLWRLRLLLGPAQLLGGS
jgi:phosphohistidine phosphatase